MMRNLKRFCSLLLAFCMILSMSAFASAAEVDSYSGTVGDSAISWFLDADTGRLVISGVGDAEVFQSKDDQPWAAVRDQIKEVWFEGMGDLAISNLAYWFADCTSLVQAEIPYTTPVIGEDAFAHCPALEKLLLYHMDADGLVIEAGAFHSDEAADLNVYFISEEEAVAEALHQYEWANSARHVNFYDVYSSTYLGGECGISNACTCGSNVTCDWYYDYTSISSTQHRRYMRCTVCNGASFLTADQSHTFSGGTCTLCGYSSGSSGGGSGSTGGTDTSCSHGSYSYSYDYYNTSYHSYSQTCRYCYEVVSSSLQSHSTSYSCSYLNASTHSYAYTCYLCNYTVSSGTAAHTWSNSYSTYSATQHLVTNTCTGCNYSTDSYENHSDGNSDGNCDACGYGMSVVLTWNQGNGTSVTTTQTYGMSLALPTTPTREGYVFQGWFTAESGGTQVTAATIYTTNLPTTFYAQWEMAEVFSVTVPALLPLAVSAEGEVCGSDAVIENHSTGAVKVTGVTVSTQNGWTLVPYATNMARAKVDAKQLGFSLNDTESTLTGVSQSLALTGDWTISKDGNMALDYDAVVSAMSEAITDETILSVVFVFDWA